MASATKVIRNFYRDSVSLMQLSARLTALAGICQASAIMASDANLALLREAKLLDGAVEAGPNDLLIAVEGDSDEAVATAIAEAEGAFDEAPATGGTIRHEPPRSLEMGLAEMPAANLALISTPGAYAAAEAMKALRLGLDVMLFSDNVTGADEIALKRFARDRGLMVMGPDCGTAIVNGVPLGFANVVRRGPIGVVAASGTGLQQVTTLVDRMGAGISQAIGTGGHDLSAEIGGITMLQGLEALAADPETEVIVLVSKPPAKVVADIVLAKAREAGKPVVVNFLGADATTITGANLTATKTLEDAANAAVALANPTARPRESRDPVHAAETGGAGFASGQKYVRGLYSGGTFCYEAALLLGEALPAVYSNTPVGAAKALDDAWKSRSHTIVDLGDDLFTRGRPHPMIDHRLRNERMLQEADDPETAVILIDVVLGYGAHPDPASEMVPAIEAAREKAKAGGRTLRFVGFVCGTEGDPQGLARQTEALEAAGMILLPSNAQAVRFAKGLVGGAS